MSGNGFEYAHGVQRQASGAHGRSLERCLPFHALPASEELNHASDNRIAAAALQSRMACIETRSPDKAGRSIEVNNCSGGIMPKLIAKYAPALAAFGVLTSASFAVNAQSASHGTERSSAEEVPSVTVRYADLNLSTPAGIEALHARLRSAAREVCNVREKQALAQAIEAKTCYRRAVGAALDKLPALAPHASIGGRRGHEDAS